MSAGGAAPGGFADALIDWQQRAGRHDLPWQRTRDPYRIWVSEIMLQQTQVATVLGYYERFLASFPDVGALAAAPLDAVLAHWSGLGYYSRARNLHACARAVVGRHGGDFPDDPAALEALPGIGRSTAAAIAAFAWGVPAPILDGNVKRVLCRVFALEGFPGERAVEQRLWALAARELPPAGEGRMETYTQALMDLGATLCVRARPRCADCPVEDRCEARAQGRVDVLPTPRPARVTETRGADWLLLRAGDAVLLERRASSGLWGGLWSLPEPGPPLRAAAGAPPLGADAIAAWAATCIGPLPRLQAPAPLAEVRHAFTHFRLRARVWQVLLPGDAPPPPPAGHLWLALSEVEGAPLPRPVKTLLAGLVPRLP
ncbi:MAG: A/G-specific adenine glycosylase [Burkholderiales bacterium]